MAQNLPYESNHNPAFRDACAAVIIALNLAFIDESLIP
jgi:hypothetical protein